MGWGIGWWRKYQDDLFFRTTIHIVALQATAVVLSVVIFSYVLHYTNKQVVTTVLSRTASIVANYPEANGQTLSSTIDTIQNQSVQYVFLGIIVMSLVFGVLLAYVTLRPARDALHYQKLFISNIAHELRTPLSTIKISTEVTLLDRSLASDVRKMLHGTVAELDRASQIINNLLSLNRLIRPEKIEFEYVDLGSVVDSVVKKLSSLANEHEVQVRVDKDNKDNTQFVYGNVSALEQIVMNLVKNSISYTPKGKNGNVVVSITTVANSSVRLLVADEGVGISKEDLFHIFEPFYRADSSRTRRLHQTGSGLGLTIVNEMVRMHNAKIHVHSTLGHGTTVTVDFPQNRSKPANYDSKVV